MFDIGATEVMVIAVVAILVIGPKDLPRMLRTIGQYVSKLRAMAREFQHQFEEAARDTGLDEVRQGISSVQDFTPSNQVKKAFNSIADEVDSVKADVESATETAPPQADTSSQPETPAEKPAPEKPAPKKAAAKKPVRKPPAARTKTAPAAKKEPAARKSPAARTKTAPAAKKKPAARKTPAARKRAAPSKASTDG